MSQKSESPEIAAIRSLALLAQAEDVFPYGGDDFRRALDAARRAIGQWAIGLSNDIAAKDDPRQPGDVR